MRLRLALRLRTGLGLDLLLRLGLRLGLTWLLGLRLRSSQRRRRRCRRNGLRHRGRKHGLRRFPVGKAIAPDKVGRPQVTHLDQRLHLEIADRPMPLAIAGKVPLDRLLVLRHALPLCVTSASLSTRTVLPGPKLLATPQAGYLP